MGRERTMGDTRITIDEWFAALEAASQRSAEGWTTRELAREWGVGMDTTRRRLREMIDAGRVRMSGVRYETSINGRRTPKAVFQIVEGAPVDAPSGKP